MSLVDINPTDIRIDVDRFQSRTEVHAEGETGNQICQKWMSTARC